MTTEKPLRILHCFRSPVGGVFRHVRDLVEEHAKLGHEVGILCDSSTGGEHEEKLFEQIKPMLSLGLIRLPIGRSVGPSDLGALWKAYQHIKSLQPDVIHGHSAKGGVLARLIGSTLRVNRYRVARLYSPHGGSLHYDRKSLRGQVFFNVERILERFTDALCFVCHYEQNTYTQKVGKPHTQARMIYNGVQESEFAPVPLNANASHFLYIGMLRDLKGPDVFIDAFTQAEKLSGQNLTGVIVGDGPERDKYRDAIAAAGLSDRLVMHPSMPARKAFALADTVVVPSRAESLPYIILEALAAGKPVIASRVGGISEIMGEQSPALVTAGDATSLAQTMVRSLQVPEWRQQALPDTIEFRQRFSTPVMAGQILGLYRELLTRT